MPRRDPNKLEAQREVSRRLDNQMHKRPRQFAPRFPRNALFVHSLERQELLDEPTRQRDRAAATYLMTCYGVVFDRDMIANVVETDLREAWELLNPGFVSWMLAFGLLPCVAVLVAPVVELFLDV